MAGPTTTPNPRPKPSSPVRLIAIACLALVVLVGLIVLITWLVIRPRRLEFSIEEGFVHGYGLNNSHLNSTFDFIISVRNPNKRVSVYYETMQISVSYDGQNIAYHDEQGFFQPRRNVTTLRVEPMAQSVVLPGMVAQHLRLERTGGSIDLDVRVRGRLKFKVSAWKSRHYKLKVMCSPVLVSFNNVKKFQRTDCDVDI